MSIADKLVTIAENEQRVYKAGQLNVLSNAESLNGSLSGKGVSANDVIDIEHNIPCQLTSDTVTDFSSVKVSRYGKNLLDISNIIGKTVSANGGTLTCGADGGITGSGTPTNIIAFSNFPKLYLPKGTYTLSRSGVFENIACSVYVRDAEGKQIFSIGVNSQSNAVPRTINLNDYPEYSYLILEIKRANNNIEMSGTAYFQLELGETATSYELSKLPTAYTANSDGTVNGITSIAPSMTVLTDTEGVVINANYYKDPDIVISNIAQNVALTGGE